MHMGGMTILFLTLKFLTQKISNSFDIKLPPFGPRLMNYSVPFGKDCQAAMLVL